MAATAVAGGLAFGFREVLGPDDAVPIVINHWAGEPAGEDIVIFFHPEVPEATLVLVR